MVKLLNISTVEPSNKVVATIFSDTKSEVTKDVVIEGMPEGLILSGASICKTATGDYAVLGNDGNWNWI